MRDPTNPFELNVLVKEMMSEVDVLFDKIFKASPLVKEKARYNELVEHINFLMEEILDEAQAYQESEY
jgi:hypothetical protein